MQRVAEENRSGEKRGGRARAKVGASSAALQTLARVRPLMACSCAKRLECASACRRFSHCASSATKKREQARRTPNAGASSFTHGVLGREAFGVRAACRRFSQCASSATKKREQARRTPNAGASSFTHGVLGREAFGVRFGLPCSLPVLVANFVANSVRFRF